MVYNTLIFYLIFKHKDIQRSRTTDKDLRCGNKSGHHQNKTILRTTEMNTLRAILGKTRFDRMKNTDILERSNLRKVVKFVKTEREHGMNMLAEQNNGSLNL